MEGKFKVAIVTLRTMDAGQRCLEALNNAEFLVSILLLVASALMSFPLFL